MHLLFKGLKRTQIYRKLESWALQGPDHLSHGVVVVVRLLPTGLTLLVALVDVQRIDEAAMVGGPNTGSGRYSLGADTKYVN
jgi:hypothetical protein